MSVYPGEATAMKKLQTEWKRYVRMGCDILVWLVCSYAAWILLRIVVQIFLFASFSVPSDSMEPTLRPGDYVAVNKLLKGARIFNVEDAIAHEPFGIKRLPGMERFHRNEVLVFNFPYPERWDSIGFDVMLYYVKRCVAVPGDTVEIRNARYRVRGTGEDVGHTDTQRFLSQMLATEYGVEEMKRRGCWHAYPYDSRMGWTIKDFGPLYVPARGDSVRMDSLHFMLYRNLIEWEQHGKLTCREGHFYLDGTEVKGYRFKENYYFMGGDNCFNSQDSRYWGLLPECYIVGKATRIWKSVDRRTGDIYWNRIWKRII